MYKKIKQTTKALLLAAFWRWGARDGPGLFPRDFEVSFRQNTKWNT